MTDTATMVLASADYFLLIMVRTGGLVIASPIFGRVNVPLLAKLGLVLSTGFLLFLIFPQTVPLQYTTLFGFMILIAGELLLGMAMAFVVNMFFSLVAFTAGQLIDMQIGFGIVNVFDPQNNTQVPMMGNVLNILLIILFFGMNGHLRLIEMIYLAVDRMPVGTLVFSGAIGATALELFIRAFMLGVMMALPIIASGLTLEIAFGMIMRAVPQIHMMVVGMPMKVLVGLFVFSVTLPTFASFSQKIFEELFLGVEQMFANFIG